MGRAFNFYDGPVPFPFHSGAGSGTYLIYPWQFSGYYTPPNITQGTTVGFLYQLDEDNNFYPETISIAVTSNFIGGNSDVATVSTDFYGLFWPLLRDTGSLEIGFSGGIKGVDIDNVYQDLSFSPKLSGGNIDNPTLNFSYSSNFTGGFNDNPTETLNISGSFPSGYNTIGIIDITFSGGWFKIEKEQTNINVYLSGISIKKGGVKNTYNLEDSGNFNVYLKGIIVNLSQVH